jgi:hypothetical protein
MYTTAANGRSKRSDPSAAFTFHFSLVTSLANAGAFCYYQVRGPNAKLRTPSAERQTRFGESLFLLRFDLLDPQFMYAAG